MSYQSISAEICRANPSQRPPLVKELAAADAQLKGQGLEEKYVNGDTPLTLVAAVGCDEAADILVKRGADVNAKNSYMWTPLIYAANNGHLEMVQFLLQHGADWTAKDWSGKTALDYAKQNKRNDVVKVLEEHEMSCALNPPLLHCVMALNALNLQGKETTMIHPLMCKLMVMGIGPSPTALQWKDVFPDDGSQGRRKGCCCC